MYRRYIAASLVLLTSLCFAKDKSSSDYQDGVLVEFKDVVSGSRCSSSGDVQAQTTDGQTITGTTSGTSSCTQTRSRQYTLRVGEHTYVVERKFSAKQAPLFISPIGLAFIRKSVLANQLPGAHVQVRSDERGLFVRVGKRESQFSVVSAN